MTVTQYQRTLRVEDPFDIIVVGGGPSGVAAAIAAGRMGHRVALIEETGCLGGIGTSGLVNLFMFLADGVRMLVQGVGKEIIETLYQRGFLAPGVTPDAWQRRRGAVCFNGEGLKLVLDELALGAGVDVRFFTRLDDVQADGGEVQTLIVSGREGLYAMRARMYVDGTGDGTLSAWAGFPFEVGDEQGITQPSSLPSLVANVDVGRYQEFARKSRRPGDWQSLQPQLEQAIADGALSQPDLHLPGLFFTGEGHGLLSAGHLFGLSGIKDRDLSQAMFRGRKLAQEYVAFYRKYVEGCERMTHIATAATLGIRETRRIMGEYVLSEADFHARRSFPDEIGRYNYSIDIHGSEPSRAEFARLTRELNKTGRLGDGESYGIPYRALIPKGSANLLVAGRCISTDHRMQGSTRVMPCCFITGQAAGVAAALCCRQGIAPGDLDTELLRRRLREQGAYIP